MVRRRLARWFLSCLLVVGLFFLAGTAAAAIQVPDNALRYKRQLTRVAWFHWGMDAPVRVLASQIHQESAWREQARSHVGAQGLAQFMPTTASWISGLYESLTDNDPFDPNWALQALVLYDMWLLKRVRGHTECDRTAKMLSAYNGGLGWVYRDEKLAEQLGHDPLVWFGSVSTVNAGRSKANKHENTMYPYRILKVIQPAYVNWGNGVEC